MKLLGPRLFARKYEKPEKIGSILTNPAWRTDNSRSLWEVHESSPGADEALRVALAPDWILVTPPHAGVFWTYDDEMREVYILWATSVRRIIPWTKGTEAMKMKGKRLLVTLDAPPQKSSVIVTPDVALKRPRTGRVVEVGDDVEDKDIHEGGRVAFSHHAGLEIEVGGVKHLILEADQVLGIPEEGEVVA